MYPPVYTVLLLCCCCLLTQSVTILICVLAMVNVAHIMDYFHCRKLQDDSKDKYNSRQRGSAN